MRADEPIRFYMYGTGMSQLADYINQLRYERLMAKARYFKDVCEGGLVRDIDKYQRCLNIAEAYEERARRIKEGM